MKKSELVKIIKEEITNIISEQLLKSKDRFPNVAKQVVKTVKKNPSCSDQLKACADELYAEFDKLENNDLLQAIEDDLASFDRKRMLRGADALETFHEHMGKGGDGQDPGPRVYNRIYQTAKK